MVITAVISGADGAHCVEGVGACASRLPWEGREAATRSQIIGADEEDGEAHPILAGGVRGIPAGGRCGIAAGGGCGIAAGIAPADPCWRRVLTPSTELQHTRRVGGGAVQSHAHQLQRTSYKHATQPWRGE